MILLAARVTLLLCIALAAYALARRASLRHAILLSAVVASLLLPLAPRSSRVSFDIPVARKVAVAQTLVAAPAATSASSHFSFFPIYLVVAALLLLRTARSVIAAQRLRSADIDSAATIGIFRPVVIISKNHAWRDEELRAVVAHERCHALRRDPAAQLLFDVACAIYWCIPLMWIARRLAALERERACDDAVVASGADPADYAALLLRLGALKPAPGIAISRRAQLETRIRSIVDPTRVRAGIRRSTIASIAFATCVTGTAIAAVTFALPVDDPLSERLPAVELTSRTSVPATAADAALFASLEQQSRMPKTWEGNLVAERSRWALSRARGGQLLQPLREALDDSDWRVRAYAAWALAQVGDRESMPRLEELLTDRVWRMRAMAAFAIAASADPRAAGAMARARTDSAWQVRVEVAAYFAALHDRDVLQSMAADPHIAVRSAVEEALRP